MNLHKAESVSLLPPAGMGCQNSSFDDDDLDPDPKQKRGCPTCCLKTRDCLMSPECGRGLSIANTVAMCGMCLRFFVCECAAATAPPSGSQEPLLFKVHFL